MSQPEGKVGEGALMWSSNYTLLDLPDLVLDEVLVRLDPISLKNLRSVCQKTKSLVETPKFLERLTICINSNSARLLEIMNSTVQWNSFNIEMSYIAILSFVQMVRPRLSKLRIHGYLNAKMLATILTNVGPTLRTFICEGSLVREPRIGVDHYLVFQEMRDILEKSHSILQQNLIGLQHVTFCSMKYGELKCALFLFRKFLEYSPALVTLKFPPILVEDPQNNRMDDSGEVNCAPLISYVMRNKHMSKIYFGIHVKLTQGVLELCDSYEQTHGSPFSLSKSSLLDLVKLCAPIGTKLYNVPSSALPNRHHIDPHSEQCYKKCVASILCTNVSLGIPGTDYVPPGCPIKLMVSLTPQHNLFQFELSESLNVVSINFQCNGLTGNNVENLMNTLFRVVRNSVLELTLRKMDTVIQVVSLRNRLGSIFPNLKKLRLWNKEGLVGPVRFREWLNDLDHLEEIHMDCIDYEEYFQIDEALGQQLTRMRKLKRVEMKKCIAVMKFSTG